MAVNVTKKVNVAANQRFDKADFDAWQDYFEAMVARLGAVIGAPLIDANDWLVDGTLEASSITVAGSDLTVVAGCEFMLPSGHIVALADDKVFTGVLPLASASSLMVKVSANDVEDVASADNRRFWSSASTAEYLNTTNTIKQKELDWVIIPTTSLHTYIGTGYTRVATLTTAGVATWQYFFPFSDTYELKSVMGIVRRLIGQNKNSGEDSASNGGYQNTNSGNRSASSGGNNNTNSGINSASSGGNNNTNSGTRSASSGGSGNTNSGTRSASSGGSGNTNSGNYSASSGGIDNTNSGDWSASSGGSGNTNSGINSASSGGGYNTNSGVNSASSGGYGNTNSGTRSASSGGFDNTNSGNYSASSGGYSNTNSGELSCVIGGKYYELADDYCFATGYNTSLTPSGANQNLSHYFNAQTGEVRHLGNFKVGGNVNDGTGAKVVITASSGDIHTKGDLCVGINPDDNTNTKFKVWGSSGAIMTEKNVYVGGDVDGASGPNCKLVGTNGSGHFEGNVEVGGTVVGGDTDNTDPKLKMEGSSGSLSTVGEIATGSDLSGGESKVKLYPNGDIKHLGSFSQKYELKTTTTDVPGASGLIVDVTPAGSWTADIPIYRLQIHIDKATNNLNYGDGFSFDVPSAEMVSILVNQPTAMTKMPLWETLVFNGKVYIVNHGSDILNNELPDTIDLIVTMCCIKPITSL